MPGPGGPPLGGPAGGEAPPAAGLPPKRSQGGLVVVLVVLALVVVGGGAFLVVGGDDEEGSTSGGGDGNGGGGDVEASADTPEGAVRAFYAAVADADCGALTELVVQNADSDEMLQACAGSPDEFSGTVELVDAAVLSQDGSTAVVEVTYLAASVSGGGPIDEEATTSSSLETRTSPVSLVMDGGSWRLDISTFE